jgi:hypothetical protein
LSYAAGRPSFLQLGQASGFWTNDRTHGIQFRASFLKATKRTTIEGIEKYLGSGMGETAFHIIEQEQNCGID